MNTFSKVSQSLFILTFIVTACTEEPKLIPDRIEPEKIETFPSVYDSISKDYYVTNLYDYDFTVVKELPDPRTLRKAARTSYVAPGGVIVRTREVIINKSGGAPSLEKYATIPSGYVVTGVGAEITSSNYNYRSIVLQYRYLFPDGTWSERFVVYDGDNLSPYDLEAWFAVPDGSVVTNVGVRGKYDVQRLEVSYRYIDMEAGTSQLYLLNSGAMGVSGTNPNAGLVQIYASSNDWDDGETQWITNYRVILGLGLTSNYGGTTVMKVDFGYFK